MASEPTNSPQKFVLVADTAAEGTRLDALLGRMGEVGSRAEAQRLIERGAVTVDGVPRAKRHPVRAGERIEVEIDESPHEPIDISPEAVPFVVQYEDEHILVVDKPPGVVVHPSKGHASGTLVHGLAAFGVAGGDPERPGIVHRLDRDTSGLLVVARSPRAHRRLGRAMRNREIERTYTALLHGSPPPALTVDLPVGRDRRRRTRMAAGPEAGRDAVTHFRVLERLPTTALMEARLETGRTHQIRVHAESAGHQVVGDPMYGRNGAPRFGLERQFLHAARLELAHPETGEVIAIESPLPVDLERALARAR